MSNTKRYLEDISDEIGFKGEINDAVLRQARIREDSVRDQVVDLSSNEFEREQLRKILAEE